MFGAVEEHLVVFVVYIVFDQLLMQVVRMHLVVRTRELRAFPPRVVHERVFASLASLSAELLRRGLRNAGLLVDLSALRQHVFQYPFLLFQ